MFKASTEKSPSIRQRLHATLSKDVASAWAEPCFEFCALLLQLESPTSLLQSPGGLDFTQPSSGIPLLPAQAQVLCQVVGRGFAVRRLWLKRPAHRSCVALSDHGGWLVAPLRCLGRIIQH